MLFSRCVSRDLDVSQYVTDDMWKREQKKNLTNTEVTTRRVICTPSGAGLRIITVHYFAYLAPQPIASWTCRTFLQECTTQEQCYVAHNVWNYRSSGDGCLGRCMRGSTGEEIVCIWRLHVGNESVLKDRAGNPSMFCWSYYSTWETEWRLRWSSG